MRGGEERQEAGVVERLQDFAGVVLGGDALEFFAERAPGNQLLDLGFAGVGDLLLRPLLDGEAQADLEADEAQQARGVVVEAVGADGAELAAADVGQAVHGVEQQAAGGAVEREGDGVAGEVAAAEIVLNGGGGDLRLGAGFARTSPGATWRSGR